MLLGRLTKATEPNKGARVAFRAVALAALLAAFGQITLGGVVRVSGSGLGCGDDWPLCNGQIIPPFDLATTIEYSHRLSANLLGVLTLATLVLAWRFYRPRPWVLTPSVAAMGLVIAAALFGAITVRTELSWGGRLVHLAIAELLITCLVVANVAGWRPIGDEGASEQDGRSGGAGRLLWLALAGVFALILSGSYMVGQGAGSACATWPLCRGSLFPDGDAYAIHMGHRLLAAIVGLLVLWTAAMVWVRGSRWPGVGWVAAALVGALAAQVIFGAATVWSGFASGFKAVHLSLATLTWLTASVLMAVIYVPPRLTTRRVIAERKALSNAGGTAR
ncbi:MAG: heme A synthase [SAR202 cluster bacterium]|nr:heme A synthase [SAR202 cluster bacterium]